MNYFESGAQRLKMGETAIRKQRGGGVISAVIPLLVEAVWKHSQFYETDYPPFSAKIQIQQSTTVKLVSISSQRGLISSVSLVASVSVQGMGFYCFITQI